ncbi:MAG: hypothetical protein ACK5MF_15410 [Vibrio sp.]|uniref:hypothetical protein n=1 Tax=Vibrio sp. TaxID=678 RepID=UPI003A847662
MNVEDAILNAIDRKQKLTVVYHGGRQPGSSREIGPISYNDDTGKVRAKCYTTGTVKSFLIHKMAISEHESVPEREPDPEILHFDDIESAHSYLHDTLKSFGWVVAFNESEQLISLHHSFKNGKIKKTLVVSIGYEEWTWDMIMDENGNFTRGDKHKKQRPWTVRAKGQTTSTFSDMSKAVDKFVHFAEKLA